MHLSKWKWAFASAFLLLVFPCGRVFAQGSLPSGWSDGDIGSVGVTGSASYTSNVFTVKGSGAGMTGTADGMNLVYQTLSGDGTIVARVVSSSAGQAGVMIRETLNANAADAFVIDQSSYNYFYDRTSTGAIAVLDEVGTKWKHIQRLRIAGWGELDANRINPNGRDGTERVHRTDGEQSEQLQPCNSNV